MDDQSPLYWPFSPVEIQRGTFERLKKIQWFGERLYEVRTLPTKDDDLPAGCVMHGGEKMTPFGDGNVGDPHFEHTLELLISLVAKADSTDVLSGRQKRTVEEVKRVLLSDTGWLQLFEKIESINVTYHWPRQEEVLLCEARITIVLFFRSDWPPCTPNDLEQVETTFQLTPAADPVVIISEIPSS